MPLLTTFVVIKLEKLRCSERNYLIKINIQWVGVNTYCAMRNNNIGVRKKSGLVEFSRASRFSRSLARLASG